MPSFVRLLRCGQRLVMEKISLSRGAIHLADSPVESNKECDLATLEAQLLPYARSKQQSRSGRVLLMSAGATCLLLGALWSLLSNGSLDRLGLQQRLGAWALPTSPSKSSFGAVFPPDEGFCDLCDCSVNPPRAKQSSAGPLSSIEQLGSAVQNRAIDIYCTHVFSTKEVAYAQMRRSKQHPDQVFSWDFSALKLNTPTLFLYTKTASHGKTGSDRLAYLQRHANAVARHRANVTANGYHDGVAGSARQVLWIIVDDGERISEDVAALLALQSQPYLYMAYGPTRRYGNAQLNAALSLIEGVSSVLAHGPVVSADDDSEIHEDLLDHVWKVKKIGVWPMGNLGQGFEGPTWQDGKVVAWQNASNKSRKFALDWGSFTYPSSLLGTSITGPNYMQVDNNGGESDFLERFVESWDELESICPDPTDCHFAWHDQPIEISTLWLQNIAYPFRL